MLGDLVRRVLVPPVSVGEVYEVECRLYDGWLDWRGDPTEKHHRARRLLPRLLGVEQRVRLLPQIATSLACRPDAELTGTYKNRGQKMVDQMLAQDALYLSKLGQYDHLLVIANDDDYVPAMLAIAAEGSIPIRWLRKRRETEYDHHYSGLPIIFLTDGAWT